MSKGRALLASGCVSQRDGVPIGNAVGLPWRNQGHELWIPVLQRSVAPAMVAVEVGVEQHIQRRLSKLAGHQSQCLAGMTAIAGIDECRGTLTSNQGVVGREPPPFENGGAHRLEGVRDRRRFNHGYVWPERSVRRVHEARAAGSCRRWSWGVRRGIRCTWAVCSR